MRTQKTTHLAKTMGWQTHTIRTTTFIIKAYGPLAKKKANTLTIYLEGDGLAWISDDLPSDNPTPIAPTALKIAVHDQKSELVAYLARPCQFVFNKEWVGCRQAYWTNLRFSTKVVNAMDQAVDYLKKYYHVKQIILIGYSGGGTIAALLTAKRTDVTKLITIAAVLDLKEWVNQKKLTPLNGSLDPAEAWNKLTLVSQTHWVGGKDTVVPKEVAFAFAKHFSQTKKPQIIILPDFDHVCCWAVDWTPF
ncbi:MAG TPA: alpha/beta hydrolase [Gammaproteobacteria bacterium]|nr:alpha/beta hydrolase [Gammaproteobacteria bacterium]